MNSAYQEQKSVQTYLEFLSSENGQIQQQVLTDAIVKRLQNNAQATVLDVGCGPGWLTQALSKKFPKIQGCDVSAQFVEYAQKKYPDLNFLQADISSALPYPANFFDYIVFNMAAPDVEDLAGACKNIFSALKPGGKLVMTIPNPFYTYPVAVWKRGILGRLFGKKPKLKFLETAERKTLIHREFGNGAKIVSHHYTLEEYVSTATKAGFALANLEEIKSKTDSKDFNLRYQLYRYPLILLLEFLKP